MNQFDDDGNNTEQNSGASGQNGNTPEQNSGTPEKNDNMSSYGGNVEYKWNYDDFQKALVESKAPKEKKKMTKGFKAFIISICSVFAVAVLGLAGIGIRDLALNNSQNGTGTSSSGGNVKASSGPSLTITNTPSASSASTTALSGQLTTAQINKKVSPSVVGVISYSLQSVEAAAEGTGIIMSPDGYIITNEHVIDGADKVSVVLSDKTEIAAKVVGKDLRTDLAVLKITKTGLTAATFGDSSKLQVGDTAVAIGNPGGVELADTVTQGIISALNRTVTSENGYTQSCIQTDASINPGNSGGPLVNVYGQIVGITSSKIADVDYEGIGFAIPINTAKPIIDDLIKYSYVQGRVKLGISVKELSSYQAKIYGYEAGLRITAIEKTSDAYKQGLQQNDVITKINGISVTSYDQFYQEESKYKAGNSVTLTIFRYSSGQSKNFTVKVKLLEDKGTTSTTTTSSSSSSSDSSSGSYTDPFSYFNQGNN
ncbi:MAG TPA: trypsin-like peptidase domain-containing protein [Clostridia bacterium]|nr:trypsin-like peptidase domain-containing protein [Clostridia bacterium]